MKQLSELKMNQKVKTIDIFNNSTFEEILGKELKFVGKSFHFVSDTGLFQSINVYAKGFNRDDYED